MPTPKVEQFRMRPARIFTAVTTLEIPAADFDDTGKHDDTTKANKFEKIFNWKDEINLSLLKFARWANWLNSLDEKQVDAYASFEEKRKQQTRKS